MSGLVGLFFYSILKGFFVLYGVINNLSRQSIPALVFMLFTLVILMKEIWYRCRCNEECLRIKPLRENTGQMIAVISGALITFLLSKYAGVSAIISSGIVGIIAGAVFPPYAVAAFCGSFAGMVSQEMFNIYTLLLAGVLTAVLYHVGGNNYIGIGGKLGTTAFFGTLGVALMIGEKIIWDWTPDYSLLPLLIIFGAVGALATHIISEKLKTGVVVASGAIGLIAGIVLPLIFKEDGGIYASLLFCASFAGMASKKVIKKVFLYTITGVVSALVFFFSFPYFNGLGGKLGTIAFIAVIIVKTGADLLKRKTSVSC